MVVVVAAVVARADEPPKNDAGEGRGPLGPSLGIGLGLDLGAPAVPPPLAPAEAARAPDGGASRETAGAAIDGSGPPPAEGGAPAERAAHVTVERVTVDGDPPAVRLVLSGAAKPLARVLPGGRRGAYRIYVDVPHATLAPAARGTFSGAGPVRRVRTGSFDAATARVVVELARKLPFRMTSAGTAVTIAVDAPPAKAADGAPRAPAAAKPAAANAAKATKPAAPTLDEAAVPCDGPPPGGALADAAARVGSAAPPAAPPASALAPEAPATAAASTASGEAPVTSATLVPPPAAVAERPVLEPGPIFAPSLPAGAALFVWPIAEGPVYAAPDAAPLRRALAAWRAGTPPRETPALGDHPSAAARFLAADLTFLAATAGRAEYWTALAAYERAVRDFPDFPDAPRGQLMIGQTDLALGLAPEATAAFTTLPRRYPESPLVADAKLGQVTALRLRHRPAEAQRLLDEVLPGAAGDLRCRAERERTALARVLATPAETLEAFRKLEADCPRALDDTAAIAEYAEALAGAGDPEAARRLLVAPRDRRLSLVEQGRLLLLAGRIAADAGDVAGARAEYELVVGMKPPAPLLVEAKMRLALLEESKPGELATTLAALAKTPAPAPLRAVVLGEAADAAARAGRYDEALGLLERASWLGRDGQAQADGRRAELLGRWIAAAAAKQDDAGLATVYSAYTTYVEELAAPEDRLTVARALARLGLHAAALRLMQVTLAAVSDPDPAVRLTLLDEALAAGEWQTARQTAKRFLGEELPPEVASRARGVLVRAALGAGDVEAAAAAAQHTDDWAARAAVADALLASGDPAPPETVARARALVAPALGVPEPPLAALLAAGAGAAAAADWPAATEAYRRALAAAGAPGPARTLAAAGLARAAHAAGDDATAAAALRVLGGADDPLVRRAAAVASRVIAPETATP